MTDTMHTYTESNRERIDTQIICRLRDNVALKCGLSHTNKIPCIVGHWVLMHASIAATFAWIDISTPCSYMYWSVGDALWSVCAAASS